MRQGLRSGEPRPTPHHADSASTADSDASAPSHDTTGQRRPPRGFGPARLPSGPRTFADLLASDQDDSGDPTTATGTVGRSTGLDNQSDELLIDDTKAAVLGIRKLTGRHLILYTDVPTSADVDELPAAFDAAVPLWCQYFDLTVDRAADWQMIGFLMSEKNRFAGAGMYPDDLPPFPHGYQRRRYLWLYEQTDDYYRRHLLLHEGTHAFMDHFLGGIGPPWYAEGMAELLATHRWQDRRMTLAYFPRDKSETPGWGRIKLIRDEAAAARGLMPEAIMNFGSTAHRRVEAYAWCWGLAVFLDVHPLSQASFRRLRGKVSDPDLTVWFKDQVGADWPELNEQWQLFVMNADYGYDILREQIQRVASRPLPPDGVTTTIAVGRGWQSSGIRLEPGATYRVRARGRYQLGRSHDIWWCEPNGITLHYHQGRPLGMLLGAVRDDARPLAGLTPLARPDGIGLETDLTIQSPGTLYLRINDRSAGLADNVGQIEVQISSVVTADDR